MGLVESLCRGFPLIGELPRSGTLPQRERNPNPETADSISYNRCRRNAHVLERVMQSNIADPELACEFERKYQEEVTSQKAVEVDITSAQKWAVLTPRFAADQGFKVPPPPKLDALHGTRRQCIDLYSL